MNHHDVTRNGGDVTETRDDVTRNGGDVTETRDDVTTSRNDTGFDDTIYDPQRRHIAAFLVMGLVLLAVGGIYGVLQSLDKMNVDLYKYLPPFFRSYYVGLTLHGVTLALLFMTFFNIAFLTLTIVHGLKRPLISRGLAQVTFWLSAAGAVTVLIPMFRNDATVLWTFYAPLRAHPAFYIGLTLVAVSSWGAALNAYLTWRGWKKDHPNERTPLMAFVTLAVWVMWVFASVGLAVSLLFYLIPWSFGTVDVVNPLLTRALYWFTGHPLVYFWLLPAYVSWYTMLPKQVGGKLFSESLSRLVFLAFIPFAIPTGLHHMYTDPGVGQGAKLVHGVITYAVILPSMVTAFTVLASVEIGARNRGGKGWIRWVLALPWFSDPSVAGQLLALIIFAGGGITGIINASYGMNLVVHNTMFVVGHFHMQVAGAVILTIMAVCYWLVPLLTKRALLQTKTAVFQVWLWFFGLAIMARGMHWMGVAGAPRRTFLSHAPYSDIMEWRLAGIFTGWGALMLFASAAIFFYVLIKTAFISRQKAEVKVPEAETMLEAKSMPRILDRFTPWVLVTIVMVALAWFPTLYQLATKSPSVPGIRLW